MLANQEKSIQPTTYSPALVARAEAFVKTFLNMPSTGSSSSGDRSKYGRLFELTYLLLQEGPTRSFILTCWSLSVNNPKYTADANQAIRRYQAYMEELESYCAGTREQMPENRNIYYFDCWKECDYSKETSGTLICRGYDWRRKIAKLEITNYERLSAVFRDPGCTITAMDLRSFLLDNSPYCQIWHEMPINCEQAHVEGLLDFMQCTLGHGQGKINYVRVPCADLFDEGATRLVKIMLASSVEHWDVCNSCFKDGPSFTARVTKRHDTLGLSFYAHKLGDTDIISLANHFLTPDNKVAELSFANFTIHSIGVVILAEALSRCHNLTHLMLENNCIDTADPVMLTLASVVSKIEREEGRVVQINGLDNWAVLLESVESREKEFASFQDTRESMGCR